MPFFNEWYGPQLTKIRSGFIDEPEEQWMRIVALLGILHSRFYTVDLQIPERWTRDRAYCAKTYSLIDLWERLPVADKDIRQWDDNYSRPDNVYLPVGEHNPWVLRQNLTAEFVEKYLQKIRKLFTSTGKKSSNQEIITRDRDLRLLLDEAGYYGEALKSAFCDKFDDFKKEFESIKSPIVGYTLEMLRQTFFLNTHLQIGS